MKEIRILVPVAPSNFLPGPEEVLKTFESLQSSDLKLSCRMIRNGPQSIESRTEETVVVAELIELALEAEADGVQGIVIDCMGDPGVEVLREAVSIPVLGPAQTSMHTAANIGHSFSVLTVLERSRPLVEEQVRMAGLESKLASVRVVDLPVLEISDDTGHTMQMLTEQAEAAAREDHADIIIPGCTGYVGMALEIEKRLHSMGLFVRVLDPMPLVIHSLCALIDSGHSHSKAAYPDPNYLTARS